MLRGIVLLLCWVATCNALTRYSLNSTFNLVKHLKSITASNTCGNEGPELYCLLTGTPLAPGLDWAYSRYPGEYIDGQFCNTCNPGQHSIGNAVDESEDNWWQSSSLAVTDTQQMTIELDLGQEYQAVYFVLKSANSPRPARWVLEKSTDNGLTWQPWQIYVSQPSECMSSYETPHSDIPVSFTTDDEVVCTSYYSSLMPLENGQIYTSLVNGRPGAELFYLDESPRLQRWMKVTDVRLRLEEMQNLHHIVHERDETANRRFFYSIRELILQGRCSCNGHADYCASERDGAPLQCECKGNTCGANCERCCEGYSVFPWQPSSAGQYFRCERCQCFGHAEECHYEAAAEGASVDEQGRIRGGAVCEGCRDNTAGNNCERCIEGYYRSDRENSYDATCRPCDCDLANIALVEGQPFGSCDQSRGGQCACREGFGGRRCDECRGDYYNTVDFGLNCVACDCDRDGTVSQLLNCGHQTGECFCKENVAGEKCGECEDETFNLTLSNEYGCTDCSCNLGGAQNNNCDKVSGQCLCKPGLTGRQCNQVEELHYIPGFDFLALEPEDGLMRGYEALYDFEEGIFADGFHGRGYATLSTTQPTVDMEIEIPEYKRYKVQIRYQLQDNFQGEFTGRITATNKQTGESQEFDSLLETCVSGCDVTLERCDERGICSDVYLALTPGPWTISFSYNAPALNLDRIVLTPRNFEDPMIAHANKTSCTRDNEVHCLEFQLPNIEPYLHQTADLDTAGTVFEVTGAADHVVIFDFHYDGEQVEEHRVTITDGVATKTGYFSLHYCNELQMCRDMVRDEWGEPLKFASEPGQLRVVFEEEPAQPLEGKVYLAEYTDDLVYVLKPQYICIRGADTRCTLGEYPDTKPSTVRPATKGYIMANGEKNDLSLDYIEYRSNYDYLVNVCGTNEYSSDPSVASLSIGYEATYEVRLNLIGSPGVYRVLLEYFYTGLQDLTVGVEFKDSAGKLTGTGLVEFTPCNGYTACRTFVINSDTSTDMGLSPYFQFTSKFVLASLVDFPAKKCILLNEIITTVSPLPSLSLLQRLPLDRTEEFLTQCSPEKTENPLCFEGYLTIAAEFFSGLPHCGCNEEGSLSGECEEMGGQCPCRENVIGRTCDQCAAGYFGFPNCQPCPVARCAIQGSGHSSVCSAETGECKCAPNVVGDDCGTCAGDAWGYDAVLGCRECACQLEGSIDETCNIDTGFCYCKNSTITGPKCESCVEGRTNYPACEPCGCDTAGSTGAICNGITGQCPCKERVTGVQCDECDYGYFNLRANSSEGCEECFCFGVTSNCTSASMTYYKMGQPFERGDTQGWMVAATRAASTQIRPGVQESPTYPGMNELTISTSTLLASLGSLEFYWISPFNGDLTLSYGGDLKITHKYEPRSGDPPTSSMRVELLSESSAGIYTELRVPDTGYTSHTVRLETGPWLRAGDGGTATKPDIMIALSNVRELRLRGDLSGESAEYSLLSVTLDSAYPSVDGASTTGQIHHLEQCTCPDGYSGFSCQDCSEGFYRVPSLLLPLGECIPCDCNGHSDTCDQGTGLCTDCRDNTRGDHCELCEPGYYGDGPGQGCRVCPCPLPLEGNSFGTCNYDSSAGISLTCDCERGYEGPNCGECASGYYGNPEVPGSSCVKCGSCSNNTDTTTDYCDRTTGDCIACLDNTAGAQCEVCAEGYYGDAVFAKNCEPCECDWWGTVGGSKCDQESGQCECLPHVEGHACDSCRDGYWQLRSGGVFFDTRCKEAFCGVESPDSGSGAFDIVLSLDYSKKEKQFLFFNANGDMTEFLRVSGRKKMLVVGYSDTCQIEYPIRDPLGPITLHVTVTDTTLSITGWEESEIVFDRTADDLARSCVRDPGIPGSISFYSGEPGDRATYTFPSTGTGCVSCECNVNGTIGSDCDPLTGQCSCYGGVEGDKCDSCSPGFYGLSSLGHCTACDCNIWGSNGTDCDKDSGQCSCAPEMAGRQCDICDDWSVITGTGCVECTGCSVVLRDYIGEIAADIGKTIRLKESGGRINEDGEVLYQIKQDSILTRKAAYDAIAGFDDFRRTWGTENPVEVGSVKYEFNKLSDKTLNIDDQMELVDDATRVKEDALASLHSSLSSANTTYNSLLESLRNSTERINQIKISSTPADQVEEAIERSKAKIKKMKGREIAQVEDGLVEEMAALNATVFANFGPLVTTDLATLTGQVSTLSAGMKASHSHSVNEILAPIDTFRKLSDSITGQLSNYDAAITGRYEALVSRVGRLEEALDEQDASSTSLDSSELDRLAEEAAREDRRARAFIIQNGDSVENGGVTEGEKLSCNALADLLDSPQDTVQEVTALQKFNEDAEELISLTSSLSSLSIPGWPGLGERQDNVRTVSEIILELSAQTSSLVGKVETADLQGRLKAGVREGRSQSSRLETVQEELGGSGRGKREVEDRSKRAAVEVSAEEDAAQLQRKLKKLKKSSSAARRIERTISDTEERVAGLVGRAATAQSNLATLERDTERITGTLQSRLLPQLRTVSLAEKMRQLDERMAAIKTKVSEAKEALASVPVGVKMTERGSIRLPLPAVVAQSTLYTGLSLHFRSTEKSGTILLLGSTTSEDRLELGLTGGRLQLQWDLGEGSASVVTEERVSDGEWRQVRVSRTGKTGYLSVTGSDGTTSYSGSVDGVRGLLELGEGGFLCIGCTSTATDQFSGSITRLRLNNEPVGLWNLTEASGVEGMEPVQVVSHRRKLYSAAPRNGLCMMGWGYTVYPCSGVPISRDSDTTIEVKVQTLDRYGDIFSLRNVNTSESVRVVLENGKLGLLLSSSSRGEEEEEEEVMISDYSLHLVSMTVAGDRIEVGVDGVTKVSHTLSSPLDWDDASCKELWVGGQDTSMSSIGGVLQSVSIDGIKVSMDATDATTYTGMAGECISKYALPGITFSGRGWVHYEDQGTSFGEEFVLEMTVRSTKPAGILAFASHPLGFYSYSLALSEGQVEFSLVRSGKMISHSAAVRIDDGAWHYVKVARDGTQLTLVVDGFTSSKMLESFGALQTRSGLYLGGVPSSLTLTSQSVPQLLPLDGALKSISLDNESLDHEQYTEATGGVSLAGVALRNVQETFVTIE